MNTYYITAVPYGKTTPVTVKINGRPYGNGRLQLERRTFAAEQLMVAPKAWFAEDPETARDIYLARLEADRKMWQNHTDNVTAKINATPPTLAIVDAEGNPS
jgi:hypothetical protein